MALTFYFDHLFTALMSIVASLPADAAGDAATKIAGKFNGIATALGIILIPLGVVGITGGALMLTTPAGNKIHSMGWYNFISKKKGGQ